MLSSKFTLLYVENDPCTIKKFQPILENITKELYIAKSAEEGLEFYLKYTPDIVLTGIGLPKMDGLDMARKIKSTDLHKPIGVLTHIEEISYLERAIDVGINEYIVKPVDDDEILKRAINHLAKNLEFDINIQKERQLLCQQAKIEAIVDILSNIAHQWRQPLSIISTAASGIKLQQEFNTLNDEVILHTSDEIIKTTKHLSEVIDTFRNVFNNKSTKELIDIKTLILKTMDMLKAKLYDYNIEIILQLDDIKARYSESEMFQVLLNILDNAKDSVLKNEDDERLIFIKLYKKDEQIYLNIYDNGGGISENAIERIFEPYFTTKHQSQDRGVSMYVTREIVTNNFKGNIHVENKNYTYNSKQYTGADILVSFPLTT